MDYTRLIPVFIYVAAGAPASATNPEVIHVIFWNERWLITN